MRTIDRSQIQKFFKCHQKRLLQIIRTEPEVEVLCAARDHAREFGLEHTQAAIQREIDRREGQ